MEISVRLHHAKKAGKYSFILGLSIVALPVVIGLWASRHAHRKIQHPILKPLAIAAIMIPALFAGRAWAAEVASLPHQPQTQATEFMPETKTEKKFITETIPEPFEEQRVDDATLTQGQEVVRQEGRDGLKTVKFLVTLKNGQEVSHEQVNEELNTPPTPKIIAVGTKGSSKIVTPKPKPAPKPTPRPTANTATTSTTTHTASASPTPSPTVSPQATNPNCTTQPAFIRWLTQDHRVTCK